MRVALGSPVAPLPPPARPPGAGRAGSREGSFATLLDERQGPAPASAAPAVAVPAGAGAAQAPNRGPAAGPAVRAMLERTLGTERQVDALLEAAARGKTFSPAELLALQATVARYSQTVEVISRVADRLVGAVKQTMGTQI